MSFVAGGQHRGIGDEQTNYCKRQNTSKNVPAVRRMGKGRDAERMLFTARKVKGNRHRQKGVAAVVPSQRASSLLHARQVARTLDVPHRPAAQRRSAPLGAECALASRALVRMLMPVSHHRRFDRGIWRHPAHCSDTTHVKGCAGVRGHKNAAAALSYVYFRSGSETETTKW
jgi:hypothetical protein